MIDYSEVKIVKDGLMHDSAKPLRGERKPEWLKVKLPTGTNYQAVKQTVRNNGLSTVCEEAKCPNMGECWDAGTATIMLMGSVCTRACKFCAVDTGNPKGRLDPDEPNLAANAVKLMGLKYIVLTSVDRDDLPDGGASHYANCILKIKELNPETAVEALTPDFQGDLVAVKTVLDTDINVYAQNLETVKRLTHPVRDPRASYNQTLKVLKFAKEYNPKIITKTSLMLGLGETEEELLRTMADLRSARVDMLTLGQYLRPTTNHLPVQRYVPPEDFEKYRQWGLNKGFLEVVSGPLVRSSYRAERALQKNNVDLMNI